MDLTICNGLPAGLEHELFANLNVGLAQISQPTILDALMLLQDLITTYIQDGNTSEVEREVLSYWFSIVDAWIVQRQS